MTPEAKKSLWIQLGVGATAAVVVGYETFKHWIQKSPTDPTVANPYPKSVTLPNTNAGVMFNFPIALTKVHFARVDWTALQGKVGGTNITEARAIRDAHAAIDSYLSNAANLVGLSAS